MIKLKDLLKERNLDGTGPEGKGPRTGRKKGKCKPIKEASNSKMRKAIENQLLKMYKKEYAYDKEDYDYDDIIEWANDNLDNDDLDELAKKLNIKTYFSDDYRRDFLELHAHHTMGSIDNEDLDDEIYSMYAQDAMDDFERKTKVDLYALGRSARHICVELTIENLIDYNELQAYALKLEKEVIKQANKYKG